MCVHVICVHVQSLKSLLLLLLFFCAFTFVNLLFFILNTQLYGWSYQLTNFKLAEVTNFMHDFRICHSVVLPLHFSVNTYFFLFLQNLLYLLAS